MLREWFWAELLDFCCTICYFNIRNNQYRLIDVKNIIEIWKGDKMLTEERYSIILERVKQNKSVKLLELCEL